ncbi:MAG: radical SAM family heme chaperone HemW [Endomicrobium sp.]|jgi:oxygen-independent coproporphyrinogen-3 oxidase|nr:radical SAM family heme chaperone HemW [Endomicrobium sp.]
MCSKVPSRKTALFYMLGLYIHIPFCKQKCFYCDFFSVEYEEKKASQYVQSLSMHCGQHKNRKIDTAYIGGGTPSVLSERQISTLLKAVNDNFETRSLKEFTFELNPESTSCDKLKILKEFGVNRLSMGLQSVDDEMLKKIGRVHNFATFEKAYESAVKSGFDNFNLDLIYGLPGQSVSDWENDLNTAVKFGCGHVSLYPLNIEEHTPFFNSGISVDEDLQREMYEVAVKILADNSFNHYEISNWAKLGKESLHNGNYWRNFEYIAVGAGAAGYENRFRYLNIIDVDKYMELIVKGLPVKQENDFIDDTDYEAEAIMLGLRLLDKGADINTFKNESNKKALQKLLRENKLINENGRVKLPKNMIFISNVIMSHFMK